MEEVVAGDQFLGDDNHLDEQYHNRDDDLVVLECWWAANGADYEVGF